jgi:hypothetical protein
MDGIAAIAAALPECPLNCFASALFNSTCATDRQASCLCFNQPFQDAATACITAACSVKDGLTAKNLTLNMCHKGPEYHPLAGPTFPISTTFLSLAGIAVLLRLYSRYHLQAKVWWDDLCDVIGLFFCTAFVGTNMHMIRLTHGYDLWFIEFDTITEFLLETYICFIFYLLGRSIVRLSIILFYMRIFQIKLAKDLLVYSFVINVVYCISAVTVLACQCSPVNYFWNQWDGEHEGRCLSTEKVVWACAAIAFVFDLWLILFPMAFIARLKLSWQKKLQASIMFIVGLAVLITSAFRFTTLSKFSTSKNPTRDSMEAGLFSALELEIGIICACLPSLQVFFRPAFATIVHWTYGRWRSTESYQLDGDSGEGKRMSKIVGMTKNPLGVIRLTTTIRQDVPTPSGSESDLNLPMHGAKPAPPIKAEVKSEAWA